MSVALTLKSLSTEPINEMPSAKKPKKQTRNITHVVDGQKCHRGVFSQSARQGSSKSV